MFEKITDYCDDFMTKYGDSRALSLPTMGSPKNMFFIIIIYLGVIKIILPKFMENRKPYEMKKIMVYYNAFQVLLSSYIFLENAAIIWCHPYSFWKCNSVDYSNDPLALRSLMVTYVYYLSKYTEFLDTVFFSLRKKFNQVTFLHLYHHSTMPVWIWLAVKFYGGGSITYNSVINSFIHIVMYTYYLISGLGPQYQKYVWWKKYMTTMQLIQFIAGLFHIGLAMYLRECNISNYFFGPYFIYLIFMYILFSNFYKKQYKKPRCENTSSNGTMAPQNHKE